MATKKRATKRVVDEAPPDNPYQIQQEEILTDLDPHLQEIVLRQRREPLKTTEKSNLKITLHLEVEPRK